MKIKNKGLALVISIFAILFSICVLSGIGSSRPSVSTAPVVTTSVNESIETTIFTDEISEEIIDEDLVTTVLEETDTTFAYEDTNLTIDEAVENAIKTSGAEKDHVTINDDLGSGKGKIVLIYLKAQDKLTKSMIKKGMFIEANSILKNLQEREEISEIVIFWSFPLVDNYGNIEEGTILKVGISKETLDKINFDNFIYDNIPTIADDYFEHTALSK